VIGTALAFFTPPGRLLPQQDFPLAHAWGDIQHEVLENLKNAVDLNVEDLRRR